MITWVFVAGLAAMATTQMIKAMLPWQMQAWTKLVLTAAAGSVAFSLLMIGNGSDLTATSWVGGPASAGLAIIFNEVRSALSMASDNLKIEVIRKARRPPTR